MNLARLMPCSTTGATGNFRVNKKNSTICFQTPVKNNQRRKWKPVTVLADIVCTPLPISTPGQGLSTIPSDYENTLQSLSKAVQDGAKTAPWEYWSRCACTKPASSQNNSSEHRPAAFLSFQLQQSLVFMMWTSTRDTFLWEFGGAKFRVLKPW